MRMIMMTNTPIDRGDAADDAQFVAGHLSQLRPRRRVEIAQHQEVLYAAGEHDADDDPDGAGQVAHLRGQDGSDERAGTGDGGEVVTEQHPPVGRHVVRCRSRGSRPVSRDRRGGRTIFVSINRA